MKSETEYIDLYLPDDFHHHLRDGELLTNVVKFASQSFDNVLVMPNIKPPVKKVQDAKEYLKRIKKHIMAQTYIIRCQIF